MPNDQSTTPPLQDVWTGCYSSNWQRLIIPEAFAHPAKFSRGLIQTIYQHCAAEGWLKPGDTVLDCFAGTGLGGLDAALAGYRFIGVELELRFCALAHGFDCGGSAAKHEACSQAGDHAAHHVTGNLELWARRYGHLPQYVAPTLLQGDSRRLGEILREQVEMIVSSPPYSSEALGHCKAHHNSNDTSNRSQSITNAAKFSKADLAGRDYGDTPGQLGALPPGTLDACLSSPPYAKAIQLHHEGPGAAGNLRQRQAIANGSPHEHAGQSVAIAAYGTTEGQLGALPPGTLDACLASPPFAHSLAGEGGHLTQRPDGTPFHQGQSITHANLGTHPAQLGNLPAGQVEAVIASPPYADGCHRTGGPNTPPADRGDGTSFREGQSMAFTHYGTHPAQLGNLPAGRVEAVVDGVVCSPPYAASANCGGSIDFSKAKPHRGGGMPSAQATPGCQGWVSMTYGDAPGQLGNERGTTFWDASKQILQQVFDLLKPNGIAIFVVKDYVRDGAIVPFSQQWQALCQHVGFVTVHIHHALLVEDHGTQGDLLQPDTPDRKPTSTPDDMLKPLVSTSTYAVNNQAKRLHTKRVSFFRRLHEKKRPDLAIDHETVLCLRKPADSPGGAITACCASPPYTGNAKSDYLLSDDGKTRQRDVKRGYKQGHGCFRGSETYGQTEGQLGAMAPGSVDAVCASPPYAGAGEVLGQHNGIDWRKTTGTGQALTPGRTMQPYGQTEGQLGQMTPGSLDLCLSSPPYAETANVGLGGIDFTKAAPQRKARGKPAPHTHGYQGGVSMTYGTTPGQLGNMREGSRPHVEEEPPCR